MSPKISRNIDAPASTILAPIRLIANRPAITTTEPPRSGLRATCPFSRARLRCLGVAFSVRSSLGMCQATCSAPSASPTLTESWLEIQLAVNGSDAPTTSSATATFVGKPTANTFSCGTTRETMPKATSVISSATSTGAATSSAPVNTVAEDLLDAADQRGQPRPAGQRHELEGAVEAAQRPGVAADHQEDERADERVEACDDGGFLAVHGVDQVAVGEAGDHVDHRAGRFDGGHQHGSA